MTTLSPIQQFYKGKSIFVTGGSGFVGQIIIEKLLRCCDVKQIFVLIRCKKGKKWNERIDEIFEDQVRQKFMSPVSIYFIIKVLF